MTIFLRHLFRALQSRSPCRLIGDYLPAIIGAEERRFLAEQAKMDVKRRTIHGKPFIEESEAPDFNLARKALEVGLKDGPEAMFEQMKKNEVLYRQRKNSRQEK